MMSPSSGFLAGFTINFPEEPETAQENIREIGPQVMFSPPRIYEQMVRTVQVKYLDATWIKRKAYEWSMAMGPVADLKFAKTGGCGSGFLARFTVHRSSDHLGLSRIRHTYTGGAMGPDHFLSSMPWANLKQIYGQTEIAASPPCTGTGTSSPTRWGKPSPHRDPGHAEGRSFQEPSVFWDITDADRNGQILRDGWLYSGDTGLIDKDGTWWSSTAART
jgi:long-chain acyl-CoA synthetase